MILVDTSVIVDYLRSPTDRVLNLLQENAAAVCGVTRAEVLAGARDRAHLGRLSATLDTLEQVAIPETTWDLLGNHLAALRAAGVTVPLADAIIATIAIDNDLELWARDDHFARVQSVLPSLKLFHEPP